MSVFARAVALGLIAPASVAMADSQLTVEGGLNCSFGAEGPPSWGLFVGPALDFAYFGGWWNSRAAKPTFGAALRTELRFGLPMRFSAVGRAGVRNARQNDQTHFSPFLMALAETGLSVDTKGVPAWLVGLRTGLQPVTGSAQLSYGLRDGLQDFTIGLGGHVGLLRVDEHASDLFGEGRPVRDASGAPQLLCPDSDEPWLNTASEEHTAVAAFLSLALELQSLGAPAALVQRCLRAADQEIDHAMAAYRLAARHGEVRIPMLSLQPRALRDAPETFVQLALESWLDGHRNEGAVAAQARDLRSAARSEQEHDFRARVAVEEAGHAELGAAIARWAALRGGDAVVQALARVA